MLFRSESVDSELVHSKIKTERLSDRRIELVCELNGIIAAVPPTIESLKLSPKNIIVAPAGSILIPPAGETPKVIKESFVALKESIAVAKKIMSEPKTKEQDPEFVPAVIDIDPLDDPKPSTSKATMGEPTGKRARPNSSPSPERRSKKQREDVNSGAGPSRSSDSDDDFRPPKRPTQSDSDEDYKGKRMIDLKKMKEIGRAHV